MPTQGVLTFTASEVLAPSRRVKIKSGTSTEPPEIEYADAGEQHIGVTEYGSAIGGLIAVRARNHTGTTEIESANAFSVGATLYGAVDGKISGTLSGSSIAIAIESAGGSGELVEVVQV